MNKIFIDTSTQALILILFNNNGVIDYLFDETKNNHSEKLMSSLDTLLNKNTLNIKEIDEFYVTEGPGSYTGVRIGVTVAKMLSYTLNKPLYKISSLKVIAASYMNESNLIVPIIDARRGNAFTALYEVRNGKLINLVEDSLLNVQDFISDLETKNLEKILFVGIDSVKFNELINDKYSLKATLTNDFKPERIIELDFELVSNVHGFVPNYKRLAEAEMNLYEKLCD